MYLVMDGDVEKAREAFKKAVALDPNFLGEMMSIEGAIFAYRDYSSFLI